MSSILKVATIQNTGGNDLITTASNTTSLKNPNGTTGLAIDSSGRVTQPTKPAWRIGRGSSFTVTSGQAANTVINFNLTSSTTRRFFTQGGITVSSGVVTVPVSGLYHVGSTVRFDGVGAGYTILAIRINNDTDSGTGTYNIKGTPDTNYFSLAESTVFDLNANDQVKVYYYVQTDTNFDVNLRSYFWGYLIG